MTLANTLRILTIIVASLAMATAGADVLVHKDGTTMYGRIVATGDTIVFRERSGVGQYIERRIPVADILSAVTTIDESELEQLSPDKIDRYFELAERLAVYSQDPEARELAIRLYLIVGKRGTESLRISSLRALVQLARSGDEEIAFRRLAFLADSQFAADFLRPDDVTELLPTASDYRATLEALQAIRQGKRPTDTLANVDIWQRVLEQCQPSIQIAQLRQWSQQTQFSTAELLQLLVLEQSVRSRLAGEVDLAPARSWGDQAALLAARRDRLPTWENVTEFSPDDVYFARGRWSSRR